MPLEIREAQLTDAAAIAPLLLELGHAGDETAVRRQLERVLKSNQHVVFLAEESPHGVLGLLHAGIALSLVSRPYCEVGAFIVATPHREMGIGRTLLEHLHAWSLRRGVDDVVIRASRSRKAAHRFCGQMGYTMHEEQRLFTRDLAGPKPPGEPTVAD